MALIMVFTTLKPYKSLSFKIQHCIFLSLNNISNNFQVFCRLMINSVEINDHLFRSIGTGLYLNLRNALHMSLNINTPGP